jgi:hypothetical protein
MTIETDVAIVKACYDLGELLGIPADVRTWRRISHELVILRLALHIEGDQTATDAARALEDVAAHVVKAPSLEIGEADDQDGGAFLICGSCGSCGGDIEHAGDCLLALAWRALGKPGPVGSVPP